MNDQQIIGYEKGIFISTVFIASPVYPGTLILANIQF